MIETNGLTDIGLMGDRVVADHKRSKQAKHIQNLFCLAWDGETLSADFDRKM